MLATNRNPTETPAGTAVVPQTLLAPPRSPDVAITGECPSQRTALDTLGTAATVKQEPKSPTNS